MSEFHVRRAVDERLEAHAEEFEADEHDGKSSRNCVSAKCVSTFSSPRKNPGSGQ